MATAASPVAPATKALSVLDLAFFVLETRERMSNVGPLAVLQPPAGTRSAKAFADRLMKAMKRQPVGAPFNYRYRAAGLRGLPCLEQVPDVNLDAHCHRLTLPAPGTDAQLFERVCRLHEKRLDRTRPPWEFYIIDGLERGRIALYAKVHHGLIDGRGFVEVCTRWFGVDPADRNARALWQGLPVRKARAADAPPKAPLAALATQAAAVARSTASLYAALLRQSMASAKLAPGTPLPFLGTPGLLRARPSVRRHFACCMLPLARMKAFGKQHAASVNDVLLTVLDMALNRHLGDAGHAPFVADMPVSLAREEGGGGNRIAALQLPLGSAAATPLQRLAQICARTAAIKEHVRRTDASALVTYTAAVHGVPALLELLHVERGPMLANMMISNPFGLAERRYLAGAELEMALPVSLLSPGQALNVTAVTYDQTLQLGFIALAAQIPQLQRLADLTVEALEELTRPPAAARPRRNARRPDPSSRAA